MSNFVHLHNHSEYSLLDGLPSPTQMVARTVSLGQPALAITDHGNIHGVVEFYRSCKKAGIKPIIGIEAYITNFGTDLHHKEKTYRESNHILLLAVNQIGYKNIIKLATIASTEGFYYKPRIDYTVLEQFSSGLIATTGCMAAEIPKLIRANADQRQIDDLVDWYKSVFGEHYFVELQHHPAIPEMVGMNHGLIRLAQRHNLKIIATNDAHYAEQADSDIHDTLLCIQTKSYKNQTERMRFAGDSFYLKSRAEMENTLSIYGLDDSIYDNTLLIAEMCNANPEEPASSHHMPDIQITGTDYIQELTEYTLTGLEKIYGKDWADNDEVLTRVSNELDVISKTGFAQYYLIVKDILDYAEKENIIWNIRGSGASSIICYALGLSFIDPLDKKLLFSRFLNEARVSIPDLDIDFPDDKRNQIITYLINKYGEDRVAQIVTFSHLKARAAIRDIGRVYGYNIEYIDTLAKMVPNIPGKPITIADSLNKNGDYPSEDLINIYHNDQDAHQILDISMALEETLRQSGLHASAIIISDKNLLEYTALMRPTSSHCVTKHITQFDYPTLESLGLLKVDCLGSATLAIMQKACDIINIRHTEQLEPKSIPYEGVACYNAFKLLASGNVTGIFQVESYGMRSALKSMRPTEFQHIADLISLYRPGPIEYMPEYIEIMHGEKQAKYSHQALIPYIQDTQGIIIYQEQIIAILSGLAGYSQGEADIVRKGISKKDPNIINKNKQKFIEGCAKNNIDEPSAVQIWNDIEKFALYGFGRAHAASYARITMQTAYLKAIYPLEYMAACLIIEQENYEKVIEYIFECNRMGIEVLPPDINESKQETTIVGSAIRLGFTSIKNVGESLSEYLSTITNLSNINDILVLRASFFNKRSFESLIACGVFDTLCNDRELLYHNAELIIQQLSASEHFSIGGQYTLFKPKLKLIPQTDKYDLSILEKGSIGMWLTQHPIKQHVDLLRSMHDRTTSVSEAYIGADVIILCAVLKIDEKFTKKGDKMAFVKLSDLDGICDAIVFPKNYIQLKEDEVVVVTGKVRQMKNDAPILIIEKVHRNIQVVQQIPVVAPVPTHELHFKFRYSGVNIPDVRGHTIVASGKHLLIQKFTNGAPNGIVRLKDCGIDRTEAEKLGLIAI